MKILFTGGGTGGHFYPIIAVAEAIHALVRERKIIDPELYYVAPEPYERDMLVANNITFVRSPAGKMRRYFSLRNFFDTLKTTAGIVRSFFTVFSIYPDVIFSKGGYASFPVLVAARFFRIPVVIHESDAAPGRVNAWAGKFAEKIAVSYQETEALFPKGKTVWTGNPIRTNALHPSKEGANEYLKLEEGVPVIYVTGGSQGAQAINEAMLMILPQLVEKYQIIHQTGGENFKDVQGRANLVLHNLPHEARYKAFGYLDDLALRMTAGVANLVISRAGSSIFEIAAWGVPSILIPLPNSAEDHQSKNAYAYARAGAGIVMEQNNLTPHLLISEIHRIMDNPQIAADMSAGAKKFAKTDAAHAIADMILTIALSHEPAES